MPKIAISYRRTDSNATGRIFDRLVQRYGKNSVFRDIDSIPFGIDFRKVVIDALRDIDVLIAIVGRNWGGAGESGKARIKEDDDVVRIEIETALQRDIPIIPVLVDGAFMPKPAELPESLRDFSFRNAASIDSGRNFDTDIERLGHSIDRVFDTRTAKTEAAPPTTTVLTDDVRSRFRHLQPQKSWQPSKGGVLIGSVLVVAASGLTWFMNQYQPRAPVPSPSMPSVPQPEPKAPLTTDSVPTSASATIKNCDGLAASPTDETRPAGIAGIELHQINHAEAIPACRAALVIRPNDPRVAFQLARALSRAGGAGNDLEAVRFVLKAADAGHAGAMAALGVMYLNGRGVAKDEVEAVRWYRKAADAGNLGAMTDLAGMLATGRGVAKDVPEALRLYRKAAEAGFAWAMTQLGFMYENGQGVTKDITEATRWFLRGAEAGNSYGLVALGTLYEKGAGVTKNDEEAVSLYRKAVEAGNALGMTFLANMYRDGRGVTKNEAEAVRLYRKAVDANPFGVDGDGRSIVSAAMINLGIMYENGRGVAQDRSEAMRWYRRAAEAGDKDAAAAIIADSGHTAA